MPHLLWSASTTRCSVAVTKARLVSASIRLGVVKPARLLIPCTPMNTMSRCNERSAPAATGPTRASEGVRTPPVSTTVRSARCEWCSTSATWIELVTTVRPAMSMMCEANCQVVVPAVMPMADPGRTSAAAAMAIACFSRVLRCSLASNPGSSVLCSSGRVAPPCTLASSPASSSTSRSRRTVMSLTPSNWARSLTRAAPRRRTSARITSCRWRASARVAPRSVGGCADVIGLHCARPRPESQQNRTRTSQVSARSDPCSHEIQQILFGIRTSRLTLCAFRAIVPSVPPGGDPAFAHTPEGES